MSGVEKLARVLDGVAFYDTAWRDTIGAIYIRTARQQGALRRAERILADPGPLLEALAEAGVLREQRGSIKPMVRGGWAHVGSGSHTTEGRRYATEWEPTDARA